MKTPVFVIGALLAIGMSLPMLANAGDSELGAPIVELMPHVNKLAGELDLNAEQQRKLAAWKAEAPLKRKALEAETRNTRKQLRDAILQGADRMRREQLKQTLAAQQTRLIEMRSLCTRMLRQTLTTTQFAQVVASYQAADRDGES